MPKRKELIHNISHLKHDPWLSSSSVLNNVLKGNPTYTQRLRNYKSLPIHNGCVNSIVWNASGSHILSGSDDQRLVITDPFKRTHETKWDHKTTHRSNIFCARFLPNTSDEKIISCSGAGVILVHDLQMPDSYINRYECHDSTCYKLLPVDANTFLSCSEDKTVRFYDIRVKQSCCCRDSNAGTGFRRSTDTHQTQQIVKAPRPVSSMALHPLKPYEVALGVADSSVYIHDRRMLDTLPCNPFTAYRERYFVPELLDKQYRVTSVTYSLDGREILASISQDYLYLFQMIENEREETPKRFQPLEQSSRQSSQTSNSTPAKKSKKLRLRGDWSDTGPNARPSTEGGSGSVIGQARPTLQNSLMERMTEVLSHMLTTVNNSNSSASALEQLGIENEQLNDLIDQGLQNSAQGSQQSSPGHSPAVSGQSSNEDAMEVDCPAVNNAYTKYTGHRNARTMIKEANFWGSDYVVSGSDCGHIFFWDKMTGEIVCVLEGDKHVVNNVQPHPLYPILATSGIDYDVKLWEPSAPEPQYEVDKIMELVRRNQLMLEETKDTVTVPAAFLIRMMSCLSQLRQNSAAGPSRVNNNSVQENSGPD